MLIELKPEIAEWKCSGVLSRSLGWKEKKRKSTSGLVSSRPRPNPAAVNYVTIVHHHKQQQSVSFYRNWNVSFQKLQLPQLLATSLGDGPLPGSLPDQYLAHQTPPPTVASFTSKDADWLSHTSAG